MYQTANIYSFCSFADSNHSQVYVEKGSSQCWFANAVINGAVNFKVSKMSEFCRSMSMLALQQKDAVAAAEKSEKNSQYVNWLKEKGPCCMNITSYVTFDSSQATGKKGNKPSTARRKGGRSGKRPPARKIIDRPDPTFQDRTSTIVPTTALGAPLTNQVNSSMAATTPGSLHFFQDQSARETALQRLFLFVQIIIHSHLTCNSLIQIQPM